MGLCFLLMKTILVTGASGFIGRSVVENLCESHQITGLSRSNRRNRENPFSANAEYIEADILDRSSLESICKKKRPDIVVHCAAIAHQGKFYASSENLYDRVNHRATVALAKMAGLVNSNVHFIFLSRP